VAPTDELETVAAQLRQTLERHQESVERVGQVERERARQINWIEGEFATVPVEKRAEAADAFAIYEQAQLTDDPRRKLEILKSARKLLPRELRGDSY
jgi:hypothetical protein